MKELTDHLIKNLGVTEAQARGGAGLLFKQAKDKLRGDDFLRISAAVPGIDGLISTAPITMGDRPGDLGRLYSIIGSETGGWSSVISGFSKLGMDSGMVNRFVSIVLAFVLGKGGDGAKAALEKVLK